MPAYTAIIPEALYDTVYGWGDTPEEALAHARGRFGRHPKLVVTWDPTFEPRGPKPRHTPPVDPWREVQDRLDYFYRQTDGTYRFPNSAEGDLLKLVQQSLATNS
jgi:hypothetical protein